MGGCASSQKSRPKSIGGGGGSKKCRNQLPSNLVKVIDIEGNVQDFNPPITAEEVTSQNPNHYLCSSESMLIDSCAPRIPDSEELKPGNLYFLMPIGLEMKPLKLEDLCIFAIKASYNLSIDDLHLSFRYY